MANSLKREPLKRLCKEHLVKSRLIYNLELSKRKTAQPKLTAVSTSSMT